MNLTEATQALYAAFDKELHPKRIDGCTNCCISPGELLALVALPREQLSADQLRSYALNAPDTVGRETDFRYFLPRLLELASQNAFAPFPETDWVVRRLRFVRWQEWPEAPALWMWLGAWWAGTVQEGDAEAVADALASLTSIGESPERYLDTWLASGLTARQKLAEFVAEVGTRLLLGKSWNTWASNDSGRVLLNWMRDDYVLSRLMADFSTTSDARFLTALELMT